MPRRVFLIVNRTSGNGRGAAVAEAVRRSLATRRIAVECHETSGPGDAGEVAATVRQGDFDRVFLVGGDGDARAEGE